MNMNPWNFIGWILVIFFVIALAPLLWELVRLSGALLGDWRDARRLKRAHAGRILCGECSRTATRQTPNGFYCENHFWNHSRKGGVSFAFPLAWWRTNMRDRD